MRTPRNGTSNAICGAQYSRRCKCFHKGFTDDKDRDVLCFYPAKMWGGGGGVSATIKRGDRRADGYTSQLLMSSLISEIVRHKISPKAIDFHWREAKVNCLTVPCRVTGVDNPEKLIRIQPRRRQRRETLGTRLIWIICSTLLSAYHQARPEWLYFFACFS